MSSAAGALYPFHLISSDPPIAVTGTGKLLDGLLSELSRLHLPQLHLLCTVWWSLEPAKYHEPFRETYKTYKQRFENVEFTFLCNTVRETEILTTFGIPCILCNHNAFVDESLFTINYFREKEFDALSIARLIPFKRLELAAGIEKLALITYSYESSQEYAATLRRSLPHATWLNFSPPDEFHWLSSEEVAASIASSRTGLCLSAREGAMYSSIECPLCGVPVVTTPCEGGREIFFDPHFCETVEPTASSVRRGVHRLLNRSIGPEEIRAETIRRMAPHRERFIDYVDKVRRRAGNTRGVRERWNELYCNKLLRWESIQAIASLLGISSGTNAETFG